jgi:thiol:disulfide interchange protein
MNLNPLKHLTKVLITLGVFGIGLLAVLWWTSPERQGRAAFSATGLPERTLAEAQALAHQQSKPLLMEFSAYWCRYCRRLDRQVLSDERVKARIQEQYVFVRVDSEHPDTDALRQYYGVQTYPTLIVAAADGTFIRRLPSAYEPEKFLQSL